VTDARSAAGTEFTEARFLTLMQEPAPSSAALLGRVRDALAAHAAGTEPFDDVTLLAVGRLVRA